VRVDQLSLGVLARSRKENERRLAIHPLHVARIPADLRERIFLERGYGEPFGIADEQLAGSVAGIRTRAELFRECDIILLPKPQVTDLEDMRNGQILWGWPHCVQDEELTQLSIDRRLTLIAFEAMNYWAADGSFNLHVFHKNNEMAGYCSVLHALELAGMTGAYGRRLRAAVISFGATARGAVTALSGHGVSDVDVLTHRAVNAVASPIHSARIVHFAVNEDDQSRCHVLRDGRQLPLAAFLAEHDLVVNCVLQDTDAPLMFVTAEDLKYFAPGTLIVDVSCDEGMGFSWARPTSFAEPMFTVADNVRYYAVDHSPSYLWDSATWEISEALLPLLRPVLAGPRSWDSDDTIRRSIEIRDGVVQNPRILSFQHRSPGYPHELLPA
jgi:alanine dehydrogenase